MQPLQVDSFGNSFRLLYPGCSGMFLEADCYCASVCFLLRYTVGLSLIIIASPMPSIWKPFDYGFWSLDVVCWLGAVDCMTVAFDHHPNRIRIGQESAPRTCWHQSILFLLVWL